MSKFLKFIVHLVIVCTILGVLALVVPPFAGINTTIVDSSDLKTNLPLGSVTYAKSVPVEALQAGDSVVVNEEGGIYRYRLTGADAQQNIFTVKDTTDSKGGDRDIALKNKASRVVLTVGYLGYLLIAVQSVEGMIIIGLVILFLIILYIIAELWKKDSKKNVPETAEDADTTAIENAEGGAALKSDKELKLEEKARAQRMKEEERQMKAEEKQRRKEEKKRRKAIRTGGFVDEVEEEELYQPAPKQKVNAGVSSFEALAPKKAEEQAAAKKPVERPKMPEQMDVNEEAADFGESPAKEIEADTKDAVIAAPEAAKAEIPKPVTEIKRMAIPLYTASQLYEKAKAAGEEPDIYQDQVSGVTLFDYSKILSGEDED